ncbi:pimeloyl-ACP methyl esterase BioG family protein [Leisingera sp. ANG-Vp]|uniref:pimeloyl-ACP methyl esterase BioG family protein n=1 Tax=Leisingera sp. ANG-Vp TaxID=1577896 RepID=UPI00057E912B|nr:pimeloyl-ACP methyl esterase BioG family protein [Leisingera sp. ANG-Vp]KIC13622.1 biotin synthase [Leisingera sp. ANG-Vp]
MKFRWLKQDQAAEAIVVFGGWAVGPEVFWHLNGPQDILFASDYSSLDADLPDLSSYRRVSLLAWSFGVAAYAHWQQGRPDPFQRKVAVNGSLQPVNRGAGIPPAVFRKTVETLSLETYQGFLARVFGAAQEAQPLDVEARRGELLAVERRGDAPQMRFGRVWVSTGDKIFPSANLQRAWAGQNVSAIDAPHAPFDRFSDWEALF